MAACSNHQHQVDQLPRSKWKRPTFECWAAPFNAVPPWSGRISVVDHRKLYKLRGQWVGVRFVPPDQDCALAFQDNEVYYAKRALLLTPWPRYIQSNRSLVLEGAKPASIRSCFSSMSLRSFFSSISNSRSRCASASSARSANHTASTFFVFFTCHDLPARKANAMFVGGVVCLLAALVMRGEEGCRVCGGEDGDGTAVDGWIGLCVFRVLKQRHEN